MHEKTVCFVRLVSSASGSAVTQFMLICHLSVVNFSAVLLIVKLDFSDFCCSSIDCEESSVALFVRDD